MINLLNYTNVLFSFGEFMFWVYALVVFLLVLGTIVLLHEGGHFFFARKAGILCHEFAIGMGPVIKTIKKGETSYSIRAIPVGGFVSMAGEDTNETLLKEGQKISLSFKEVPYKELFFGEKSNDETPVLAVSEISVSDDIVKEVVGEVVSYDLYSEEGNELYIEINESGEVKRYLVARDAFYIFNKKQQIQIAPYERCYEAKTKWQRFWTVFAGPMMNFVLALFIFLIVGLASGVPNYDSSVIGSLTEGSPASHVLKEGDQILAINGNEIQSWKDVQKYMDDATGSDSVVVKFKRDGKELEETIKTINYSYRLGVTNGKTDSEDKLDGVYDYDGPGLMVTLLFDKHYVVSKAGLQNGDIILGYYVGEPKENGENFNKLENWNDLFEYLDLNPELENMWLKYSRNGEEKNLYTKIWSTQSMKDINKGIVKNTAIGISPTTHFSLFGGIGNGFVMFWDSITTVFVTFRALFGNSQITINELSGPVGIFTAIKSYLETDLLTFLSFVGMISANIGLVNLLPLPALDGGRLVFLAYEAITKKKINKKVETTLINIVFWLVIALFVYITFKDIFRLF